MTHLNLSVDDVLTTTRAVRKRLDLDRPVPREVVEECLQIAIQAPNGSNAQPWQWIVVTDDATKAGLAELYRKAWAVYTELPMAISNVHPPSAPSAQYLADNLERVPVHVIPCVTGLPREGLDWSLANAMTASIHPATWSFMLAARERGLGTSWTSLHLMFEQEAAELLGVPFDEVIQCSLIPVAFTKGTDFKPADRAPVGERIHWDRW